MILISFLEDSGNILTKQLTYVNLFYYVNSMILTEQNIFFKGQLIPNYYFLILLYS